MRQVLTDIRGGFFFLLNSSAANRIEPGLNREEADKAKIDLIRHWATKWILVGQHRVAKRWNIGYPVKAGGGRWNAKVFSEN